jgi:hypothetical protein
MRQQHDPGRATRPLSLAPPLESQDVSKYQAIDPPRVWNRRRELRALNAVFGAALIVILAVVSYAWWTQ